MRTANRRRLAFDTALPSPAHPPLASAARWQGLSHRWVSLLAGFAACACTIAVAQPAPDLNESAAPAAAVEANDAAGAAEAAAGKADAAATQRPATADAQGAATDEADDAEPAGEPVLATAAPEPDDGDESAPLVFTFQDAPWPDVLRKFANWAGLTLDLTDLPPGTFSYYDNRQHTAAEAIDILNGYLLPRGYVLLRRDRFLVALKTDNPLLPNLIPTIDRAQLDQRGENELVRMVVPLDELDPASAAEEVRQLIGPQGSVAAMENAQSLVVQGFGSSLRQVLRVLENSSPPVTDDKLDFRAFPLRHLPAEEAEQQIRTLFGLESGGPMNVSGARSDILRAQYYRSRSSGRDDDRKDKEAPPIPLLQQVAMNMQVSALARTNSLLVTATPEGLALVEGILNSIDLPQGDAAAGLIHDTQRVLRVYKITQADEEEVAKTLDVLIPGVLVNEDRRQETLHIMATPAEHARVQEVINTLDGDGDGGRIVEVIALHRANPLAMESLLAGMFDNEDRDERPVIQADAGTRTLVVRGTVDQLDQVRQALSAYGEGDDGAAVADQSRFRRIPVGGRSAALIAEAAERILAEDAEFESTIRVVVPRGSTADDPRPPNDEAVRRHRPTADAPRATQQGPQRINVGQRPGDRRSAATMPARGAPTDAAATAADAVATLDRDRLSAEQIVQLAHFALRPPKPDAEAVAESVDQERSDDRSTDEDGSSSSVSIEVRDDQLFLYSGDPAALSRVEETIRELVRQMPERTRWTVFYLRAAEAAQAATRLYELTLGDSIANETSYAVASDVTAPPLRIIPEPRTNALFVSGPAAQVDQIQSLLDIIDAVDLPESYRERVPHTILVRHADVNEVADMLRELYKDHLTDPAAQRREDERRSRDSDRGSDRDREQSDQQRSGGPQRGNATPSPGVRMTLAVDARTSELIVACDEVLFREVQSIVQQRDQAARETQPTTQLLPIRATMPAELVDILQDLSPKIEAEVVGELQSFGDSRRSSGSSSRYSRSSDRSDRGRDD